MLAREKREKNIAKFDEVDCFVTPTKEIDSGAFGKSFELKCTNNRSKKTNVATQNKSDNHIKVNGKYFPIECKVNGGDIESLYTVDGKHKRGLIVYQMKVCNSGTNYKEREVPPTIYNIDTFLTIVEECGAVKYTKPTSSYRGETSKDLRYRHIQVSSKMLYLALLEKGIPYEKGKNYTKEEFANC